MSSSSREFLPLMFQAMASGLSGSMERPAGRTAGRSLVFAVSSSAMVMRVPADAKARRSAGSEPESVISSSTRSSGDDAVVGVLPDQRMVGEDVDLARGVDEAARRERHPLVARGRAEARRDAVDGEEGLVDAERLEQRAEARADQAACLGVQLAAGQDDLEAGPAGEPLQHVERVGDDGDVASRVRSSSARKSATSP